MEDQNQRDEELPIPKDLVLQVSGRTFRPSVQTTFEQDLYIGSMLRDAGLIKMAAGFNIATDKVSDVAADIITTAFASGKLFALLGAMMEEVDVPWTIEGAKKNAHFFAQLRDNHEKQKLHGTIVGVILAFFVSGAASSPISLSSSEEGAGLLEQSNPGPESFGEPVTMESGKTS